MAVHVYWHTTGVCIVHRKRSGVAKARAEEYLSSNMHKLRMRGNSYERKRARAERSGGMNHREQDMEGRNDRGGE